MNRESPLIQFDSNKKGVCAVSRGTGYQVLHTPR